MPFMRALVFVVLGALGPALAAAQDTAIVIQPESTGLVLRLNELPHAVAEDAVRRYNAATTTRLVGDRKSTRLNSSHSQISYAVFCLKKKKKTQKNYECRKVKLSP